MTIGKFVLMASITCLTLLSTIDNTFASTDNTKLITEINQTHKLNEVLSQPQIDMTKNFEIESYKVKYGSISSLNFDLINCQNVQVDFKVSSNTSRNINFCIMKGGKAKIGKMEAPIGRLSTLVYWVDKQPEIVADLTDPARSIVWFFSEGKLIAQLNLIGSEETLQTKFTSEQLKKATDRAFVLAANF
jgi:hypothetical protein